VLFQTVSETGAHPFRRTSNMLCVNESDLTQLRGTTTSDHCLLWFQNVQTSVYFFCACFFVSNFAVSHASSYTYVEQFP